MQEGFKYCLDVLRHFAAPRSASSQPTPQTIFLNIAKKKRAPRAGLELNEVEFFV